MSHRDELFQVVVADARYSVEAYEFAIASVHQAQARRAARRKKRSRTEAGARPARKKRTSPLSRHVSAKELCESACDLGAALYGALAPDILTRWGLNSTGDIGRVVFHLIEAGELESGPGDSLTEFEDLFDWQAAFRERVELADTESEES